MRIAKTFEVTEGIKTFLKENIPTMTQELLEQNVEFKLPEIREWKVGYVDVFSLTFYPSILIGCSKTYPDGSFSDSYDIDVVFAHKNGNKEQLIKEGYLYSDILYYLFRTFPRMGGNALDVKIVDRVHFEGDEIFLSDISLKIDVEEGEY